MKRKNGRLRTTLMIAALAFAIQAAALLVTVALVALLMRTGIIREFSEDSLTPSGTLLLMSVIGLISGLFVAMLSGKFIFQPVERFLAQINRLARGDYSARISFGRKSRANSTAQQLEDGFNKLAQELESTEMLRSDFINNFSHEFKTPIVSIAGFAKLLRRGDLTPQQQAEYLEVIETESLRLAAMANNVLDLTRVENQTILTGVTRYNLSEQIRSCVLMLMEGKWRKKEMEYAVDFDEYTVEGNEELLRQVWVNLLDNAVKFSPEGATVTVKIAEAAGAICVTVENTGSFIAPEQYERIFRKFFQADESHATEGNGIGLALVKKIVRLHDGQVEVRSDESKTAFTVTLPQQRGEQR